MAASSSAPSSDDKEKHKRAKLAAFRLYPQPAGAHLLPKGAALELRRDRDATQKALATVRQCSACAWLVERLATQPFRCVAHGQARQARACVRCWCRCLGVRWGP